MDTESIGLMEPETDLETESEPADLASLAHSRFKNPTDFTIVVGVDERTSSQWQGTWPTWRRFHPDILDRPLLVLADAWCGDTDFWLRRLRWLDHPAWSLALWDWPNGDRTRESMADVTQRERMLTAYVKIPGAVVETEYWCKIDTDAVATAAVPWVDPDWFRGNPAIVASPWSYTKPAAWLPRLDEWAKGVELFSALPPPAVGVVDPAARTHRHPRIASWICFVDTIWSGRVAQYAPDRLPVPSQDTYHWYCAARRGDRIRRVKFKRFGWTNVSPARRRAELVAFLMGDQQ